MQYFIGSHGVQSGPFTEAVIRQKRASGELPADALCWAEGWSEWRPITSVFPSQASAPPPPLPPSAFRPHATAGTGAPPTTSGLAITSFVLGLVGLVTMITAIPAVICGHIACSNIKSSQGAQTGRGLAIAGLVLGYIMIAIIPVGLVAAMAIPAFQKVRAASQEKMVLNNLRMLDAAAQQLMLENGTDRAAYAELVGPGLYIPQLIPTAGEDYTGLVIRATDRKISVTTADGRTITHPLHYTSDIPSFAQPEAGR